MPVANKIIFFSFKCLKLPQSIELKLTISYLSETYQQNEIYFILDILFKLNAFHGDGPTKFQKFGTSA